jgi:peptide deformylase
MAVLPIYNCFHPVLKKKAEPVKEFNEELANFVEDMFETMYNTHNGVGLAANQVGSSRSLFIMDVSDIEEYSSSEPIALINPVIEYFSDEEEEDQEGCLSIPEFYEKVTRPRGVQIKYFDTDMGEHVLEADGFMARVIQHEFDHLNGILFFERLSPIKRALSRGKLNRIEKGETLPDYPMILPDGKLAIQD